MSQGIATSISQSIRDTAAQWHERIRRDKVSDDTRRELADWLAHSPEHRAAYEAVERAWSQLQSAAHAPEILALRHETALRLTRRTSQGLRPVRWAAAVLTVAAAALIANFTVHPGGRSLVAWLTEPFQGSTRGIYATATSERLTLTLADSSQVTLDTQSELQVAFTPGERLVRLTRGQAFFEVAKDRHRPFVVEVHNRRFVAVGTAFDVRVDGPKIQVTMVEGTVRVERTPTPDGPQAAPPSATRPQEPAGSADVSTADLAVVTTITAGEQLVVDTHAQDRVRPADPDRATSWRRGQIIFDDTPLAEAIAEVNRYSEKPVRLADPALGQLRLSGAFSAARPNVFVEAVTSYFPIQASTAEDGGIVLSARK